MTLPVSRRSFLVVAGTTILGRFALPGAEAEATADAAAMAGEAIVPTPEELARARRLVIPPSRSKSGRVLVWVEERDDDEDGTMVWIPKTDEEWEEAERFCAAANYRTWNTFEELASQPRQRGRFVIRWIFQPRTRGYLSTADEEVLFNSDQESLFTRDLRTSAAFDHDTAIQLVLKLMHHFEVEETSKVYYDTIPFTEAVRLDVQSAEHAETPSKSTTADDMTWSRFCEVNFGTSC